MSGETDPTLPSDTEPRVRDRPSQRGATSYQLGAVIGRGGMGEVVLAHDPALGRDVALKRLRTEAPGRELIDRVLREAKVQARLDHPAIAPVHELGFDSEGLPYFTMKRVAGTTLAALFEAGTERMQRLLRAIVDVALAVELAHSRRVVHRDLKPSNIMLGDYGEVYVLDWGVARVLADDDDPTTPELPSLDGETKVGALLGTPGYMAPEQARGEPVGAAADVYALGATLFEVLTGEPLHDRDTPMVTTIEGVDGSPRKRAPGRNIAPELDAVCMRALAMDARKRPTARELANAIQAYLDGDRDQERRRALAAELVTEARAANAAGDQAKALSAAGRAAVFDPASADANQLIMELLVDAKQPAPPELQQALDKDERAMVSERSKRALLPYLSLFSIVPLLPFLHVRSWAAVIAANVAIACGVLVTWLNTRRYMPYVVTLTAHFVVVVMFSRLTGPFVLTPMLICAILLSASSLPELMERRWALVLWTLACALAPLLLEWAGVFAQSWHVDGTGLVSYGTAFYAGETVDAVVLIAGNIAGLLVVGLFARTIGRDRRDAERRIQLQLWRFQQLLPRQLGA